MISRNIYRKLLWKKLMKKERRSLCRHTKSEPKNTHNGVISHSFWHRNAINQKQIDGKRHCDSYIHFIKKNCIQLGVLMNRVVVVVVVVVFFSA